MRRTRGEQLHPANVASVAVGRGYGDKADPPGTLRVSVSNDIDDPFENMQYSPGMPVGNVQAKRYTFLDDDDLSSNKWQARKTSGSTGTVPAIINQRGGGVSFTNGDQLDDMTLMETKNEVAGFKPNAEMWVKWRIKIEGDVDNAYDNVFVGLMDKPAGTDPPAKGILNGMPDQQGLYLSIEAGGSGEANTLRYATDVLYDGTPTRQSGGLTIQTTGAVAPNMKDGNWHNINIHVTAPEQAQTGLDFASADAQRRRIHVFVDDEYYGTYRGVVPSADTDLTVVVGSTKNDDFGGGRAVGYSVTVSVQDVVIIQEEEEQ